MNYLKTRYTELAAKAARIDPVRVIEIVTCFFIVAGVLRHW